MTDVEHAADARHERDGSESMIDPSAQAGVQNIEAVTVAWTSAALTFAYVMIWLTCKPTMPNTLLSPRRD